MAVVEEMQALVEAFESRIFEIFKREIDKVIEKSRGES